MKTYFTDKENTTIAEIIWCLNTVYSHISSSASAKCVHIIKMMDPQSEFLKAMIMERTKISYAIVYGLGLHFKKEVENEIKLSAVFFCFIRRVIK